MIGHGFQSANEYKEIRVRPASVDAASNQQLQMCVKPISGQLRQ